MIRIGRARDPLEADEPPSSGRLGFVTRLPHLYEGRVGVITKPPAGRTWRAESPDRSRQDADTGTWEPDRERFEAEQPGLNQRIFYEPPYSIWESAVGLTVIVIGGLLCRWHWGQ